MSSVNRSNLRVVSGGKLTGEPVIASEAKQSPGDRGIATPRGATPFGLAMPPKVHSDQARNIANQGKPSSQSPIARLFEKYGASNDEKNPNGHLSAQLALLDSALKSMFGFGPAMKEVKNSKSPSGPKSGDSSPQSA
ncbi:MAG: hypothetical protein HY073_03735 [Deltaproteobacteria bacterium]|nr:hypothetical protein [Deltaproteobacteria bacterium]